jgi:hypothetical protein
MSTICEKKCSTVIYNNDLINITEIDEVASNGVDLESFILYNLAYSTLPSELYPSEYKSLDIFPANDIKQTNIINNTDSNITSELFALDINFSEESVGNTEYDFLIGNIEKTIYLDPSNISYYDCSFQYDLSYNNDLQFTTDNSWSVIINRNVSPMNEFAAFNSNLNEINDKYPFTVNESFNYNTKYSLFVDGYYFTKNTLNQNVPELSDIVYSLAYNNLYGVTNDPTYNYNETTDFVKYQFIQEDPVILVDISGNETVSQLSIGNNVGGDLPSTDVSVNMFKAIMEENNVDINTIMDGAKVSIVLGDEVKGGYYPDSNANGIFSTSDSNPNAPQEIFQINPFLSTYIKDGIVKAPHKFKIYNGSVTLTNVNSDNLNNIIVDSGIEVLKTPYNSTNGFITINSSNSYDRVTFPNGENTDFTKSVQILYQSDVSNGEVSLNYAMRTGSIVEFSILTLFPLISKYVMNDGRDVAINNDTLLVIADGKPNDTYYDSSFNSTITFESNYYPGKNTVGIISIENKSYIYDSSSNSAVIYYDNNEEYEIEGSESNVSIENYYFPDLSGVYRVHLKTKHLSDISENAILTNGKFTTYYNIENEYENAINDMNPVLTTHKNKVSFFTNDYNVVTCYNKLLSIPIEYKFVLDNPTVNISSIKHRIDISFQDVDANGNLFQNYATYDDNSIMYLNKQVVSRISTLVNSSDITTDDKVKFPVKKYNFYKVTETSTYNIVFNSNLPLYVDLYIELFDIQETVEYYELYDERGVKILCQKIINHFSANNIALSLANVSLNDSNTSSILIITPYLLYSTYLNIEFTNNEYDDVWQSVSETVLFDPYYDKCVTIYGLVDGSDALVNVYIQFDSINVFNESDYYVLQNQETGNYNFIVNEHEYTIENMDALNNFNLYTLWEDVTNETDLTPYTIVTYTENSISLEINDMSGNLLSKITQLYGFNFNYQILASDQTIFKVDTTIDGEMTTEYLGSSEVDGTLTLADGVEFTYIGTPQTGYTEVFTLNPDKAQVILVNDTTYINSVDTNPYYLELTDLAYSNDEEVANKTVVVSSITEKGYITKNIVFTQLRGYSSDNITILRTPSSAKFYIIYTDPVDGITKKLSDIIPNFYYGLIQHIDNLEQEGIAHNIVVSKPKQVKGYYDEDSNEYILPNFENHVSEESTPFTNFKKAIDATIIGEASILSDNSISVFNINVVGGNWTTTIENPDGSVLFESSGNLTNYQVLTPFAYSRNVKSFNIEYSFTLNVSDIIVNKSTDGFIGNPVSSTYVPYGVYTNNELLNGIVLSNVKFTRNSEITWIESFIAYNVISPPQYYSSFVNPYYTVNKITDLPYDYTEITPNAVVNYYYDVFTTNMNQFEYMDDNDILFTISKLFNKPLVSFKTNKLVTPYNFDIKGNYIKISVWINTSSGREIIDTLYKEINELGTIDDMTDTIYRHRKMIVDRLSDGSYQVKYRQKSTIMTDNRICDYNIVFNIGNAFLPVPSPNPIYLDSYSYMGGEKVSFYQSDIHYYGDSYYILFDKYSADINCSYAEVLSDINVNQIQFTVSSHYRKIVSLNSIEYSDSRKINIPELLKESGINPKTIFLSDWIIDASYETQLIGISFDSLNQNGLELIQGLFTSKTTENLPKALYIERQDILKVISVAGTNVVRITNSGNFHNSRINTNLIQLMEVKNIPSVCDDDV